MKIRTLAVAAGVSAPLIWAGSAVGGFLGVKVVSKPNPYGLTVCNVYAEFDNPGHDFMHAVAGTPNTLLSITVQGGSFYNHAAGGDTAPLEALIDIFPSLAYDSFYTIGMKAVPPGGSDHTILVNMPPLAGTAIVWDSCSWAVVPPTHPQGNPFDPVNSYPGNGQILIGQFSMENPGIFSWGIEGSFLLQYTSDGLITMSAESFSCIAHGDCVDPEDCDDGDPCNGEEICVDFFCETVPPDPDCNGNGVLDSCDIASGTSTDADGNGVPDDCDVLCPADVDRDGNVGITDFLELLANWGPCP
jgi:hypothetical protein